jgi:hypothetical protein
MSRKMYQIPRRQQIRWFLTIIRTEGDLYKPVGDSGSLREPWIGQYDGEGWVFINFIANMSENTQMPTHPANTKLRTIEKADAPTLNFVACVIARGA